MATQTKTKTREGLYTLEITCNGFHGWTTYEVRGHNWRAWNGQYVAVTITPGDLRAVYDQGCAGSDCCCGDGIRIDSAGADTDDYLIPVSWLEDCDREASEQIAEARAKCDDWLIAENA